MSKKQNLLTKFFAKNKLVESTDHETGPPDAAPQEVSIENTDEGSKAEKHKLQGVWKSKFSWLVYRSITVETLWIVIFAERQARIVLLNKKDKYKDKKKTSSNTDLQKVALSSRE